MLRHAKLTNGFELIVMTGCAPQHPDDLLSSRRATWLLWGAPWGLIVIGGAFGDATRTVSWTLGFAFAGTSCLVNARRCGRRHCLYLGPVYLLSALASLVYGLHWIKIDIDGWDWIMCFALLGTFLLWCVLEKLLGKYTAGH